MMSGAELGSCAGAICAADSCQRPLGGSVRGCATLPPRSPSCQRGAWRSAKLGGIAAAPGNCRLAAGPPWLPATTPPRGGVPRLSCFEAPKSARLPVRQPSPGSPMNSSRAPGAAAPQVDVGGLLTAAEPLPPNSASSAALQRPTLGGAPGAVGLTKLGMLAEVQRLKTAWAEVQHGAAPGAEARGRSCSKPLRESTRPHLQPAPEAPLGEPCPGQLLPRAAAVAKRKKRRAAAKLAAADAEGREAEGCGAKGGRRPAESATPSKEATAVSIVGAPSAALPGEEAPLRLSLGPPAPVKYRGGFPRAIMTTIKLEHQELPTSHRQWGSQWTIVNA